MGFSPQEQWSELPCPPPGDLHAGFLLIVTQTTNKTLSKTVTKTYVDYRNYSKLEANQLHILGER